MTGTGCRQGAALSNHAAVEDEQDGVSGCGDRGGALAASEEGELPEVVPGLLGVHLHTHAPALLQHLELSAPHDVHLVRRLACESARWRR
eukprot:scaffold1969_cov417-Prasinococcus_capsulatus_cf.AAC.4